jgi:hypothetical protein
MTPRAYVCESCGAPANVHVMHEIGRPGSAHHFCMQCADGGQECASSRTLPSHGVVLIVIGFLSVLGLSLLLASAGADGLGLDARFGFGLGQTTGLAAFITVAAVVVFGRLSRRANRLH